MDVLKRGIVCQGDGLGKHTNAGVRKMVRCRAVHMTEFVPLPGCEPAVLRVRPRKAELYDLIYALHCLGMLDAMIGKLVGRDRKRVRHILEDQGVTSRWFIPKDVITAIPADLRLRIERMTTTAVHTL